MKKRRAADSIGQQQENIENDEDNNYDEDNHYTHRYISMEEGWNDIIKPKVSVYLCGRRRRRLYYYSRRGCCCFLLCSYNARSLSYCCCCS